MNHKVAFICPLYDMKNHFDLAFNLYKSKHDLGIQEDIYFVFSTERQKDKFRNRVFEAFKEEICSLVLPEDQLHYKSKVSVKKFYALRVLKDRYSYMACVDSETLFVKKVNFYSVFNEIWEKGTYLNSNMSPDGFYIMRTCFRTLSKRLYNNPTMRKEFGDYSYNLWFNEIPVYKCNTLTAFFDWLDTFDPDNWKNEWCCFEYYIYVAYLILFENKHLRKFCDIVSNGGIMEYLFEYPLEEQRRIINRLGTHWSPNKDVINDATCLLFHLDRESGKGNYGFGLTEKEILIQKKNRKKLLCRDNILDTYPLLAFIYKILKAIK